MKFLLLLSMLVFHFAATLGAIQVVDIAGWPNERSNDHLPEEAIDGDLATYTWVTPAFTSGTNFVGIAFDSINSVNRLRMWKDNNGGGGPDVKDLVILWTDSSTATPLSARSWQMVPNLTNGFMGAELLVADTVNSNGTVINDVHDSVNEGHGWASLTFDPVFATGLSIQFSKSSFSHYKLHEIEAHIPEPESALLISCFVSVLGLARAFSQRP